MVLLEIVLDSSELEKLLQALTVEDPRLEEVVLTSADMAEWLPEGLPIELECDVL